MSPQIMVHIQNTQKMWQFPTKYREEGKPESQFILCLIIKKSVKPHKQAMLEFKDENMTYLSFY